MQMESQDIRLQCIGMTKDRFKTTLYASNLSITMGLLRPNVTFTDQRKDWIRHTYHADPNN